MYEIVRMPGFNELPEDLQVMVLNDPKNFWALDERVNLSKGGRDFSTWKGLPDYGPPPDLAALRAREADLRKYLGEQIEKRLKKWKTRVKAGG
jgi:hypothetical protein